MFRGAPAADCKSGWRPAHLEAPQLKGALAIDPVDGSGVSKGKACEADGRPGGGPWLSRAQSRGERLGGLRSFGGAGELSEASHVVLKLRLYEVFWCAERSPEAPTGSRGYVHESRGGGARRSVLERNAGPIADREARGVFASTMTACSKLEASGSTRTTAGSGPGGHGRSR